MSAKKELAVSALRSGTVIDHIPSAALFKAVRLLGLENCGKAVTIGCNLPSSRLGTKGIIKVADTTFPSDVFNRIAVIAPTAVINTINEYEVTDKRKVELPEELVDIVKCGNPKCITCNEPMPTRFTVVDRDNMILRCRYCEHEVSGKDITLK